MTIEITTHGDVCLVAASAAEIYKNSLESYKAGFENGAASRDAEVADLRQQIADFQKRISDAVVIADAMLLHYQRLKKN